MTAARRPAPETANGRADRIAPAAVVVAFLDALAGANEEATLALVADDLVYSNVSLPTIRGKERFAQALRRFVRAHMSFEVRVHRIAVDGNTVLTERTDALSLGAWRAQFWVCGTFEVENGRVTLWRDYFDWSNVIVAVLRGLVGVIVPSVRARFPD